MYKLIGVLLAIASAMISAQGAMLIMPVQYAYLLSVSLSMGILLATDANILKRTRYGSLVFYLLFTSISGTLAHESISNFYNKESRDKFNIEQASVNKIIEEENKENKDRQAINRSSFKEDSVIYKRERLELSRQIKAKERGLQKLNKRYLKGKPSTTTKSIIDSEVLALNKMRLTLSEMKKPTMVSGINLKSKRTEEFKGNSPWWIWIVAFIFDIVIGFFQAVSKYASPLTSSNTPLNLPLNLLRKGDKDKERKRTGSEAFLSDLATESVPLSKSGRLMKKAVQEKYKIKQSACDTAYKKAVKIGLLVELGKKQKYYVLPSHKDAISQNSKPLIYRVK